MNPKLAGCLLASMLVGASLAIAAIIAGWGLLFGFIVYSLAGSVALVPIALWASHEAPPVPESRVSGLATPAACA